MESTWTGDPITLPRESDISEFLKFLINTRLLEELKLSKKMIEFKAPHILINYLKEYLFQLYFQLKMKL
jgi:hypothetical protein